MEFKDVLAMYFERGMAVQTFWNFYLTIVLAYLAFLGALAPARSTRWMSILLTLGFLVFGFGNFTAMTRVANQQLELQTLLRSDSLRCQSCAANDLNGIRETLDAPCVSKLETLHFVGDALVLISIWLVPALRRPREGTRESKRSNAGQ